MDVVEVSEEGLYFSTSSRMIRPFGPDPVSFPRGTPRSRAIFLAIGEANMRSPEGRSDFGELDDDLGGEDADSGSALGGGGGFDSDSDFSAGAADAFEASSAAPDKSSPSSPTMAMAEPTATFFAPSCA